MYRPASLSTNSPLHRHLSVVSRPNNAACSVSNECSTAVPTCSTRWDTKTCPPPGSPNVPVWPSVPSTSSFRTKRQSPRPLACASSTSSAPGSSNASPMPPSPTGPPPSTPLSTNMSICTETCRVFVVCTSVTSSTPDSSTTTQRTTGSSRSIYARSSCPSPASPTTNPSTGSSTSQSKPPTPSSNSPSETHPTVTQY